MRSAPGDRRVGSPRAGNKFLARAICVVRIFAPTTNELREEVNCGGVSRRGQHHDRNDDDDGTGARFDTY